MDKRMKVIASRKMPKEDYLRQYAEFVNSILLPIDKLVSKTNNEYIFRLLIQYLELGNYNVKNVLKYLIQNDYCSSESLIKVFPDFKNFVQLNDKLRSYYLEHLLENKISVDNNSTYEINKGYFDSTACKETTIISKYAESMSINNELIFKYDNKVYRIDELGSIKEIPEGSTILIHNAYNIREFLYVLEVLAGTDNTVVIGCWGIEEFKKEHFETLKNYLQILKVLFDDSINIKYEDDKSLNMDGIYCDSLTVNTKYLKEVIPTNNLLSISEKEFLEQFNILEFDETIKTRR